MRYHASKSTDPKQFQMRMESARVELTGDHCGLCTRAITGRNREEVTVVDEAGYEEKRRVCTYCFAVFNLLTGTDAASEPVQEGFGELLRSILTTRNALVRGGKIAFEFDADDNQTPAKEYNLVGRAPRGKAPTPRSDNTPRVPDWMPPEELALLRSLPTLAQISGSPRPNQTQLTTPVHELPPTSEGYQPTILQAGNFEECAACAKPARPGKKYCEDWAVHGEPDE